MTDFVVTVILLVIVGLALRYIIKAKKSGAKCIGCAVECGSCCAGGTSSEPCNCGCGGSETHEATSCCCQSDTK